MFRLAAHGSGHLGGTQPAGTNGENAVALGSDIPDVSAIGAIVGTVPTAAQVPAVTAGRPKFA